MGLPCQFCQTENELGAGRCSGCGEPLADPLARALDPEQVEAQARRKKVLFRTVGTVVGVVVAGVTAFSLVQSSRKTARARSYVEAHQMFLSYDKDRMGSFWKCTLGSPMDVTTFKDNVALSGQMELAFLRRPEEYTRELTQSCGPMAVEAAARVKSLAASADYRAALDKYVDAANGLSVAAEKTAESLKTRLESVAVAAKVIKSGESWHSVPPKGKPAGSAIGYDKYLRCAVPALESQQKNRELATTIWESCKSDPAYVNKLMKGCMTDLNDTAAPSPTFAKTLKRLGQDQMDLDAFRDCFKRAAKNTGKDPYDPLARAAVEFINARAGVNNVVAAAVRSSQ